MLTPCRPNHQAQWWLRCVEEEAEEEFTGKLLSADMVSQCGTGRNVGFGPREGKPVGDAGRCRTGVRKSPTHHRNR